MDSPTLFEITHFVSNHPMVSFLFFMFIFKFISITPKAVVKSY